VCTAVSQALGGQAQAVARSVAGLQGRGAHGQLHALASRWSRWLS
jgi:hypothetical protein